MIEVGSIYRHYKGKKYRVLSLALHSESLETLVIYECLYKNPKGQIWARPISMWNETVTVDGLTQARFVKEKGE